MQWSGRKLLSASRATGVLVVVAMLCGFVGGVGSPQVALAEITTSTNATEYGYTALASSTITIESPSVSQDDVNAGAILIAQIIVLGSTNLANTVLCPTETNWYPIASITDGSGQISQYTYYRQVTAPQDDHVVYSFVAHETDCSTGTLQQLSMSGVISPFTGVDPDEPIAAFDSRASGQGGASADPGFRFRAPNLDADQPAGTFVLRLFGTNQANPINPVEDMNQIDSPRIFQITASTTSGVRAATMFGSALETDRHPPTFMASTSERALWVAATIALNEDDGLPPADETAPTTTASATTASGAYTSGAWTNEAVTVTFSATDETGGSGVNATYYTIDGGPQQAGTQATLSTTGSYTISYWSVDNATNSETAKTFVVNIDTNAPVTSASALTASNDAYPSGTETYEDVTVSLAAADVGGSGVKAIHYSINGGTETVVPGGAATIPVTTVGTHTISYYAVDNAGNSEAPQTFEVVIIGTDDLVAQLRDDTIAFVTNPTTERSLVATVDQLNQAVDSGNTWQAYMLVLRYVIQLDRAAHTHAISPADHAQLVMDARSVLDSMM